MTEAAEATKTEARSLVRKLSEVMGEVDRIAKNGHNDHFNYDFATESDISAAVREHMATRHLMLVPSVEKTEWEKTEKKKTCTLTVKYTLFDGDSGEHMEFTILGQGEDSGDKATYKAMAGATKYALLKLFLIPTGDDPEKESKTEHGYTPPRFKDPKLQEAADRAAPALAAHARRSAGAPPTTGSHACSKDTQVPYGKSKGTCLCKVTAEDLTWLLGAADDSAKLSDKRYGESNRRWLKAVQDEAGRRVSNSGKISAPSNTSPRQAELPVEEEILTPHMRMMAVGRAIGLTPSQTAGKAFGVVGKDAGWTHGEVDACAKAWAVTK